MIVLIRRCTPEDIEACIEISRYAYGIPDSAVERMKEIYSALYNEFYVAEVKDKVVALGRFIPFEQNIRGVWKKMGGVANIASAPDYRGQGNVRRLVLKMLEDAVEDEFATSTLYPFKDSFYMTLGYVKMPPLHAFEFDPRDLLLTRIPDGYSVEMTDIDEGCNAWRQIYRHVISSYHGAVRRTEARWNELKARIKSKFAVAYNPEGVPTGIVIYRISGYGQGLPNTEEGRIHVSHMLWTSMDARNAIFAFLYNHRDQVTKVRTLVTPFTDDYYHWTHNQHTPSTTSLMTHMARIVNVERALAGVPTDGEGTLKVGVKDDKIPTNDGTYLLANYDGRISVERVDETPNFGMTIEGLTALLYGVLSTEHLQAYGWLDGTVDVDLSRWFPRMEPWLTEDF